MNKRALLVLIFAIMFVGLAYAGIFDDTSQSDFSSGNFNFTFYNSSGFIQLNNSISGSSYVNTTNGTEMSGSEAGLVSYWRFNETSWNSVSGEVKDVLGKNNGTARNGANTTLGFLGNSGNYDGVDNKIQIINKEELNPVNGNFTITGWAKSYQGTLGNVGYQLYVAKRVSAADGYYLGFQQGIGLNFIMAGTTRYDAGVGTPASILNSTYVNVSYNTWFHFAGVLDRTAGKILLYRDGVLVASTDIPSLGSVNNSGNLSIGYDDGQPASPANGYPANGSIDEVAIWNKALNSSDILALYNQGRQNVTNTTTGGLIITSGTYESAVKDTGSIVSWGNISWNGGEITAQELPNNQATSGGVNMSGNILLMHMNEASGTIGDFSGRNNNGTQSGGVNYSSSGKINYALGFDGSNDYVSIPNSADFNLGNTLTIEAWIYPTNLSARPSIFSTRVSNPANSFQFEVGTGNAHSNVVAVTGINTWVLETQNNSVTLDQWNHVVYTRNGSGTGNHEIYVNGQLKTLQTETAYNFSDNSNAKLVGAGTLLLPEHYFYGKIDEVAVYNRVLSQEEITARYNRMNGTSNNIKFQAKTSNDNSTWSNWQGGSGEGSYYTSSGSLNLSSSRYLQYKTYFDDISEKLYNVTISYLASGENISVSLDSPADNYLTNEYNNINITCSAFSTSQLANITPYYSKFGWGEVEPTRVISGTSNTTTFTLNEISSAILWNCYACNVDGTCAFSNSNRTIIGDILAPSINLILPDNDYAENSSQNINFIFNATDNLASSLNCKLLINNAEAASNSSVVSGIQTTILYTLANGNYSWKINCSDGINSAVSEERNLVVNISSAYVPFWAKANTHTHTTNSDGDSSPAVVVGLYQSKGYNILAITDHGYVTNCTPFTNSSFICINSEEWTSTKHVVRINVSAAYNNNAVNLQNAVNAAQDEGGFSIIAHPNWSSTIWSVSDLTSLQNYTAMEIYNKVIERLSPDPYAVAKWDDVLKTGKKIFGVAADDMHQVNVDLGYGFTKVYMPEFSKQAYIDSMKTGYFYASQGPNMDSGPFALVCDELDNYHMGESANCSAVKINATISATNSTYIIKNVTLIKDGNALNITTCSSQNCFFSYSENVSSSGYYRLEATDSWNKKIWSNPIWVNKIALPVVISVNLPVNNSNISDYTPLLNVSLNQQTSLWYNIDNGGNKSLCSDCSSYHGYITLREGSSIIRVYANNSDNIVKENIIYVNLNFNKSVSDNFSDNSSIESAENVFWNNGKMSMNSSNIFGNFVFKPIITLNNITSFYVEWQDNNTETAKGDGQRIPLILKYRFGNSTWDYTDSEGNYIVNGSTISGLNKNNLSLMLDFEKNSFTPVDLLSFKITWTEFTVPLILVPINKTTTSSSAVISWVTDVESNSSIEYGSSPILESFISESNFVTHHSLTIQNLNQNTIYYFKIKSCTNDSCAEYPQSPYPVDSFTTQSETAPPSNPPGGGSSTGGGGGGMSNATNQNYNLEFSGISDLVLIPGETRRMSVTIKNTGRGFLNDCILENTGTNSKWGATEGVHSLSPGQEQGFVLVLNVPQNATEGSYPVELALRCKEFSKSLGFSVEIIEKKLEIKLLDVKREKNDEINVSYYLAELSGNSQDVELSINLLGLNNERLVDFSEIRHIEAKSENYFNAVMKIPSDIKGSFNMILNAKSSLASAFVQEDVVIGSLSPFSGLTIFLNNTNSGYIIMLLIVIAFIVFCFFMIKRIFKVRALAGYKHYYKKDKKEKGEGIIKIGKNFRKEVMRKKKAGRKKK